MFQSCVLLLFILIYYNKKTPVSIKTQGFSIYGGSIKDLHKLRGLICSPCYNLSLILYQICGVVSTIRWDIKKALPILLPIGLILFRQSYNNNNIDNHNNITIPNNPRITENYCKII